MLISGRYFYCIPLLMVLKLINRTVINVVLSACRPPGRRVGPGRGSCATPLLSQQRTAEYSATSHAALVDKSAVHYLPCQESSSDSGAAVNTRQIYVAVKKERVSF